MGYSQSSLAAALAEAERTPPARSSRAVAGLSAHRVERAFTIVEVMIAAIILALGFMGLIAVMTGGSTMMDHARRQTVANQILNDQIDNLRFASWTTINGLATGSTSIAIDPNFWPTWNARTQYAANQVVSYNGTWYRCAMAHANQVPPNATYWTAVTTGATTDIVTLYGANYSLTRTVNSTNPVTNIREITFTVTWVVTTSRRDNSGNLLTFTYTRAASAWYGKYGLNLSYQRS